MARPFVLLSVATSVDGYIDDNSSDRLVLSNAPDFDRVDEVRANSDAILIGAETMRRDNPRLLVNTEWRQAERVALGKPAFPLKVTVTASGNLDANLKFWHHGGEKLVYTTDEGAEKLVETLGTLATVVSLGKRIDFGALLDDLGQRGVAQLMVEGGQHMHTEFLSAGLVDEIHLAIAPLLVGHEGAPRFLGPAAFPGGPTRRMALLDVQNLGDVVVIRYRPKQESRG
jgi:riboflavin-specific deaminase-like protein